MKMTMKPVGIAAALIIICLAALWGCSNENGSPTEPGLNDVVAPAGLDKSHGHDGHDGPILYSADGGGATLTRIDVGTGTVTPVGPFEAPTCLAIAISPEGKAYTATYGFGAAPDTLPPFNPQLARVNRATGHVTPFGVNLYPNQFMGLGFSSDGKLYGVDAGLGQLYRFNLRTGAATAVGTPGCGDIMDLAWHDGRMYGAAWGSLFRINLHTGQATLIATLTGLAENAVMGLAIDDDGNFYVTEIIAASPLYRVNPATGACTPVDGVTLIYPHGLEFVPSEHGHGGHDGHGDDGGHHDD
jgi:sugar lactone lactonase YvrE